MIAWLSLVFAWLGLAIVLAECFGKPRGALCRCPAEPGRPHLRARFLFLVGASYSLSGVLHTVAEGVDFFSIVQCLLGVWYLWRWWRHTKRDRRKLLDRALGVVRETAAGLKVVPVPQGGAA